MGIPHLEQSQNFSENTQQELEDAKHIQAEVAKLSSEVVIHDVENNNAPLHDNVPEIMTDAALKDAEASNLSHLISLPGRTDGIGRLTGDVRAPGTGNGNYKDGTLRSGRTGFPNGTGGPGPHGIVPDPGFFIDFLKGPNGSKNVIYCLDISASMQAAGLNKLELAVQAIKDSVKSLGSHDTFNIVTFSTHVGAMSEKMLTTNVRNVERTMQYLDNFTPESIQHNQGTNILTALEASLMFDSSAIVLVTDGLPKTIKGHDFETDTQKILEIVREKNLNGTNIYVVALEIDLKRSAGAHLLISLAEEHNGQLKVLDTEQLRKYRR